VTHTILAVEDRGLRLLVEGMNTTLEVVAVVVVVVVVVVEEDTTTIGTTVSPPVAEGQGALKRIVLHHLQEDTRMTGTDNMVIMEGEVEKAMAIGKHAALPLPLQRLIGCVLSY